MFKIIRKVFLYLFISSLAYVVLIKFVNPPITITQITNAFGLGLKRDYVAWEDMSYNIKLAAIASEDQVFPDHIGFDFDAMEKSLRPKKKKKKSRIPLGGGASTITQQTAKNVFLWQGRSYFRKALEAYYTVLIELVWGKQRILEVYLNSIEMGDGIYGAEAATQHWYKRDCKSLTRMQAAGIAAILPNPRRFSPNGSAYISRKQSKIARYILMTKLKY